MQILVGQEGSINLNGYSCGGGGGTFVVRGSNTPLIIAGGGGGMENAQSRHSGCDASTGTTAEWWVQVMVRREWWTRSNDR